MAPAPTLDQLRRHAIARSLCTPTTLARAIRRLGFVQADPIRAPARAQDLCLRLRVGDYRAGDLERRYPQLALEEDFFVNYGFLPRSTHALMHPRSARTAWTPARWAQAQAVQDFVRERGLAHPREVAAHFQHGKTTNWFGGRSNASTQLLDGMHYRGMLRVARREHGVRLYAAHDAHLRPPAQADALDRLVDIAVNAYAPLPLPTLRQLIAWLCSAAAPQWRAQRPAALRRALQRLPGAELLGCRWVWPAGEDPASACHAAPDALRLLAPFDPLVWDRRRFEAFWGWPYRFEAYVPAARRLRGYYALPLLWRDQVVGWANLDWRDGVLTPALGYVAGRAPREAGFGAALEAELDHLQRFLSARG